MATARPDREGHGTMPAQKAGTGSRRDSGRPRRTRGRTHGESGVSEGQGDDARGKARGVREGRGAGSRGGARGAMLAERTSRARTARGPVPAPLHRAGPRHGGGGGDGGDGTDGHGGAAGPGTVTAGFGPRLPASRPGRFSFPPGTVPGGVSPDRLGVATAAGGGAPGTALPAGDGRTSPARRTRREPSRARGQDGFPGSPPGPPAPLTLNRTRRTYCPPFCT